VADQEELAWSLSRGPLRDGLGRGIRSFGTEVDFVQRLLMIAKRSCSTRARRLIWARDMGRDFVGVWRGSVDV